MYDAKDKIVIIIEKSKHFFKTVWADTVILLNTYSGQSVGLYSLRESVTMLYLHESDKVIIDN